MQADHDSEAAADARLHRLSAAIAACSAPVVVLHGPAGMGKSRLVARWASLDSGCASRAVVFPEACAWLSFDTLAAMTRSQVTGAREPVGFGAPWLVIDLADVELEQEALEGWIQSCEPRRMLLVLRRPPPVRPGVELIRVPTLPSPVRGQPVSASSAGATLAAAAARSATGAPLSEAVLTTLVQLAGGNPAAVRWIATALERMRPAELVERLTTRRGRGPRPAPRASMAGADALEVLWDALDEASRWILRSLAALPPRLEATAAARLLGLMQSPEAPPLHLAPKLERLARAGLVELDWRRPHPHLRLPPLVRARAARDHSGAEVATARGAWRTYAQQAWAGSRLAAGFDDELAAREEPSLYSAAFCTPPAPDAPLPATTVATALAALDELHHLRGDGAQWTVVASRVESWLASDESRALPTEQRAELEWRLGRHFGRRYEFDLAAGVLNRARQRLLDPPQASLRARVCLDLAAIARLRGQDDARERHLDDAESACLEIDDPDSRGVVIFERFLGALLRRDFEAARTQRDQVRFYWGLYSGAYHAYGEVFLGTLERYRGAIADAEQHYLRAIERGPDPPSRSATQGLAEYGLGTLAAEAGRLDEAERRWEAAERQLDSASGLPWLREVGAERAALMELQGQVGPAAARWDQVTALLRRREHLSPVDGLLAARLAGHLARRGDHGEATRWACRARTALARSRTPGANQVAALHLWFAPLDGAQASSSRLHTLVAGISPQPELFPGRWDGLRWAARALGEHTADAPATSASNLEVHIAPDVEWVDVPGARIDFRRRPMLRRLLRALVLQHQRHPGAPLPTPELIQRIWPDGAVSWDSLTARLYSAVADLRRLGLRDAVISEGDGYRLSRAVRVTTSQPV